MTAVEPVPNITLLDTVKRLAERRRVAAAAKSALVESKRAWEAANADLIATVAQSAADAEQADKEARDMAILEYNRTRNRLPAPGVSIGAGELLVYEHDRALAWATAQGKCLVPASLDVKAFEIVAIPMKLDFVKVQPTAKVMIATDLDKALGGVS